MVASTATGDDQLVRELGAIGGSNKLAIFNSEASSLEEGEGSLFGSNVFFVLGHFSGVDGFAIHVG